MNDTTFQGNGSVKYVPVVVNAKPKPITNGDRIRAMTDEELARWITDELIEPGYFDDEHTYELWLDWMKQEVDDDNNS